jgi:hypothetical protein
VRRRRSAAAAWAHANAKKSAELAADESCALVNTDWAYPLVSRQQYLQTGQGTPQPDIDFTRVIG